MQFSAMSEHHQISPNILPPPQPLPPSIERKWKLHLEMAPNCPRCASSNTKFCYYNNYSLSQPRYFCKACRRYWTKGGSLRNVPVGGGCRKTRRAKSALLHTTKRTKFDGSDSATRTESNDHGCSTGSDIDLAAVFARFLNSPNSEPQNEANALTSSPESYLDGLMVENSELFFEGLSDLLHNEETHQEKKAQEITENEINCAFGLQNEVGVDELWAGDMKLPSGSWQPQIQMQDLDCFASNYNVNQMWVSDQYSQVGDNWSSSDVTPDFEVLSTP